MSDSFVPFSKNRSKPGPGSDNFRVTILPQAQQSAPFQPSAASNIPAATSKPAPKEPQITLERDGDRITRIKVQCSCGQVIELNCAY